MKASELRIGNIIKNPIWNKEINSIVLDDFEVLNRFPELFENIKPVEITEEWLLKFGFITMDLEIDYVEWGREDTGYIFNLVSNGIREMTPVFYERTDSKMDRMEIKYVHQLQNLYFALTGEELTLKQ